MFGKTEAMIKSKHEELELIKKQLESTKKELEEYKKKYEELKYNVETFVDPDILGIKKVKIGKIFEGGNKDDLKKLILLNLDSIVDNLCYEVNLGSRITDHGCELGNDYNYSVYIICKPKERKE